jgi:hypothetical protein
MSKDARWVQEAHTKDKEQEIAIAVTTKDSRVILDFGNTISWMALRPDQADGIAAMLTHYAEVIRQEESS